MSNTDGIEISAAIDMAEVARSVAAASLPLQDEAGTPLFVLTPDTGARLYRDGSEYDYVLGIESTGTEQHRLAQSGRLYRALVDATDCDTRASLSCLVNTDTGGRGWVRTSDPSVVSRVLSR